MWKIGVPFEKGSCVRHVQRGLGKKALGEVEVKNARAHQPLLKQAGIARCVKSRTRRNRPRRRVLAGQRAGSDGTGGDAGNRFERKKTDRELTPLNESKQSKGKKFKWKDLERGVGDRDAVKGNNAVPASFAGPEGCRKSLRAQKLMGSDNICRESYWPRGYWPRAQEERRGMKQSSSVRPARKRIK